ncbi:hypothetical protein ACFLXQ_09060 [Chloroflexota bacterium]
MRIAYKDLEFDIPVEGWEAMVNSPKTRSRALTLQALCNLELKAAVGAHHTPRQDDILAEVQRLQREMGVEPLKRSPFQIQKNLQKLKKEKHVFYKEGIPAKPEGRQRGGPTSPWASRYVYPLIYETLKSAGKGHKVVDKPE